MIDFASLRSWFEKRDENLAQGANFVHEQIDRISDLFNVVQENSAELYSYGDSAVAKCLPVLLMALGWNGERRHVIEALPHAESITDFTELQMVLSRLNYAMERIQEPTPERISPYLPCLIQMQDEVGVLLDVTQDNQAFIYLGGKNIYVEVEFNCIDGDIHIVKRIKQENILRSAKQNWTQSALSSLKETITKIVHISIAINILTLVLSIYVMFVYDKAIGGKSDLSLLFMFLGILTVLGTEIKLRRIRAKLIAYLGSRFDVLIQVNTFRSIINLPLVMIESAPLSSQLARFRQFEVGRELFISPIASAILDLPFTLAFIGVIFVMGGLLGWITVALAVVFAIFTFISFPIMASATAKAGEAKTKSDALLIEVSSKLQTIRENRIEKVWLNRVKERMTLYLDLRFRSQNISNMFQAIAQNLVMLAALATMAIGALMVMEKTLSVGGLVGVTTLMWRVFMPIQVIFMSISRLKQTINTLSQINQLFRLKLEREPGHVPTFFRKFQGGIMVNGVSFKYAQATDLAIKAATLVVKPGEMVAVIGPNGAGKTTLMRLIIGLYPPASGAVRLDGLDLRQLDVGEVRQTVAYAPQNIDLFYGTVLQNVALSEPTATKERILRALSEARFEAHDPRFPDGFETRLNFAVRNSLPEGMLQRLNLARAWVKDSPLYVLDEPGTRLDSEGDRALMDKLAQLKGKSTVIFTTARPSHMMMADKVVCLVKGQIVAEGKPEDIVPKYMEAMSRAVA